MAGSGEVRRAAHHHFGDNMKFSLQVGVTHYAEIGSADWLTVEEGLPGATPEFFFAPGHVFTFRDTMGDYSSLSNHDRYNRLGAVLLVHPARWQNELKPLPPGSKPKPPECPPKKSPKSMCSHPGGAPPPRCCACFQALPKRS